MGFLGAGRVRASPGFLWALPIPAAHFDASRVSGNLQVH